MISLCRWKINKKNSIYSKTTKIVRQMDWRFLWTINWTMNIFNLNIEKSCSFLFDNELLHGKYFIWFKVKLGFSRKLCWVVYIFFEVKLSTLVVFIPYKANLTDIFFVINYEWYLLSMKVKWEVNIVFEV